MTELEDIFKRTGGKRESSTIEYKLCKLKLSKDLWETVSAFSNTHDGLILLGYERIKDRYVPVGVDNPSQVLDDFSSLVGQKFNYYPGEQVTTQVTKQVSVQVTEQVGELMDRRAKTIVFCTHPRSLKEIMGFLGMKHRPTFMKNVLNPLMGAGLLKRTIPDKPRSRFQKYVAVKKGEK